MEDNNFFNSEVKLIRESVYDRIKDRKYTGEEKRKLIDSIINERKAIAKLQNKELYDFYQGMSYKDLDKLKNTIYESDYFMDEVKTIKKRIQDLIRAKSYTSDERRDLVEKEIKTRKEWSRDNDSGLYRYYESLSYKEKDVLIFTIIESVEGLGILGKIIQDPDITEVMINGWETIFIEKAGKLSKLEEHFESDEDMRRIVQMFVNKMDRTIDSSNPIVDARLEDGSRVHVVWPPVARNGATVTIRRFPKEAMTVEKLLNYGSITPEVAEFLQKAVITRHNIFVSGGTGSGKTTFLNALSNFIPQDQRVITIEDSAELQIRNVPNLVSLETKQSNNSEANEVTIRDLIKASLRMRPDRVIVGEVRGAEALDMLQAMNTGHDGSLSTGHANSPEGMISRLETMVLTGSAELPLKAIDQQIGTAIDYIVHLARLRDKSRRCMKICEVVGYDDNLQKVVLNPIFEFIEDKSYNDGKVHGSLVRTSNKLKKKDKWELGGIYDYLED